MNVFVCRAVRTTRRATTVNAARRASTEWCEVSMTTANPALVPSPTLTTSKLSAFGVVLLRLATASCAMTVGCVKRLAESS